MAGLHAPRSVAASVRDAAGAGVPNLTVIMLGERVAQWLRGEATAQRAQSAPASARG